MGSVMPAHAQWECKIERKKQKHQHESRTNRVYGQWAQAHHTNTHMTKKSHFTETISVDQQQLIYANKCIGLSTLPECFDSAQLLFLIKHSVLYHTTCMLVLYCSIIYTHVAYVQRTHCCVYFEKYIYWEFSLVLWDNYYALFPFLAHISTHTFYFTATSTSNFFPTFELFARLARVATIKIFLSIIQHSVAKSLIFCEWVSEWVNMSHI